MDEKDRFNAGIETRRAVLGNAHLEKVNASITPFDAEFQNLITRYAWGEIWSRPGLPRSTRSLLTIAMLVAQNHWEELRMHIRASRNSGVSQEELKETLLQCAIYCGVPAANHAFRLAREVFADPEASPQP